MSIIFTDERNLHEIDLSAAVWASNKMHEIYGKIPGSLLKDVDWIAYDEGSVLLIEYKNYNNSSKEEFKRIRNGDELATSIARKFYDSFLFLLLNEKPCCKIRYVLILERESADTTIRKKLRNKISKKLPFQLQEEYSKVIVDQFDVKSVDEWNSDTDYSSYPICSVT